jgi:CRISPR-associated protein Cst2
MAFVTGLLLVDAPASALNNAGQKQGARTDNAIEVKQIRVRGEGAYPYVSAQAFRFWLRNTLAELSKSNGLDWKSAPIYREAKIAYTDSDPIKWYDDDLFGYMRAQSKREEARARREADQSRAGETPTSTEITRVSPFRVSTLVSIAPVIITEDFGVMSRHEGDPVPYERDFYRTTLKGLFSLDLSACGTFSYADRTGFRNLDDNRIREAKERELEHLENEKSYRLKKEERVRRIAALFEGLAQLEGGAKLALHYTDVMPPFVILAVTKGGNHIFNHVIGADSRGKTQFNVAALKEAVEVYHDTILSPIYVGWATGYLDEQRETVKAALEKLKSSEKLKRDYSLDHPRLAFQKFAKAIQDEKNSAWLE